MQLPLFLLRRSLMAARIIFLSSKSLDSSSWERGKTENNKEVQKMGQIDFLNMQPLLKKKKPSKRACVLLMYHLVQQLLILDGGELFRSQFSGALCKFCLSAGAIGDGGTLTPNYHGRSGRKRRLRGNDRFSLHLRKTERGRVKYWGINIHESIQVEGWGSVQIGAMKERWVLNSWIKSGWKQMLVKKKSMVKVFLRIMKRYETTEKTASNKGRSF